MARDSSRISSWSESHRDATAQRDLRRAGWCQGVANAQTSACASPLQRGEPAQLGAEFVRGGVGEAVHLIRGRGLGLHGTVARDP
jgi:hypothetical protein